jgi:uncharacterized protein with GYD domain
MYKVAVITHIQHKKTKSGPIYAKEIFSDPKKYLIDVFYNSEFGEKSNFNEFNTEIKGYDLVIIVQLISTNLLKKIKCKNIVFIPMYDTTLNWNIIDFSLAWDIKCLTPVSVLHKKLQEFGVNSKFIQYFPKVEEKYSLPDFKKIYFWNRREEINYEKVLKIFKNYKFDSLNIHNEPDLYQFPKQPSENEILKHNITFSNWYKNVSDYTKHLSSFGFYFAPRQFEGGGAAFITAMKHGCIAVTPDNYPYKDYISNNINGLIYDSNESSIEFNNLNLKEISINSYNSIKIGRIQWEKSIPEIRDFLFSTESFPSNRSLSVADQWNKSNKKNNQTLESKNIRLDELNKTLESKNIRIDELNKTLESKNIPLDELNKTLESKNIRIDELNKTLESKNIPLNELNKTLESKNIRLDELNKTLESKNIRLDELNKTLESKNIRLDELNKTLESKNIPLDELNKTLESKNIRIDELNKTLESKNIRLDELNKTLESKNIPLDELNKTLESKNIRLDEFNKTLESKNIRLDEFNKTLESKNIRLDELNKTLESKNIRIDELNKTLESKNIRIDELNKTLESKNIRLDELNKTLESKNIRIDELNKTLESKNC